MRRPYHFPHVGRIARIPRITLAADAVRPTLVSVTIPSAGTSMTLVFSKAVTYVSGSVALAGTRSSTGTYSSGSGTASLVFTLGTTIISGDVETLSIASGAIRDASGNVNAVVSGNASTNSSTQTVPSVRNVSTGTLAGGSSAVTLPTRSSGDTLVAVVALGVPDSAPAANTGWTRRINQTSGSGQSILAVYTRQSDGTDNTPLGAAPVAVTAYTIFSIQNPATGYDVSNPSTGNDALIVAVSVTTTAVNDLLITAFLRENATGSITPLAGTPTTAVQPGTPAITLRCAYESLVASGATGAKAATNSTSTQWVGAAVAVK